jgi:hypothetical protein
MDFKFHLYVQKHENQTYTVTPVPFYDLTTYGPNFEEIKSELAEAIQSAWKGWRRPCSRPGLRCQPDHAQGDVELRPVDRKSNKKRREQVQILFSLLVKSDEDKQLVVTVPRLGDPPLMFYVYNWAELEDTARTEIISWLDDETLEACSNYHHARSEYLDTLDVEAG